MEIPERRKELEKTRVGKILPLSFHRVSLPALGGVVLPIAGAEKGLGINKHLGLQHIEL